MGGCSFNLKVGFDAVGGRLKTAGFPAAEVEPLGLNRDRKIHGRPNPDAKAGGIQIPKRSADASLILAATE